MSIQKVTLVGLGSMGVFFAPRLDAYLGKNFRVLAGGARKERLESRGVVLNGQQHLFKVVSPEEEGDPADLVIVAVKYTGLAQAIQDMKNQVGPNTLIMSVLNGIDSEEAVAAVYGWERVLYSYMRVSIALKDGVANFDSNRGLVHFGESKNQTWSPRVKTVAALFDASGVRYEVDEDMVRGIWFKFMCNVGENMTCALLGIPFGGLYTSQNAYAIRIRAMREVIALAQRKGINLGQADMDWQETNIRSLPKYSKPSTLQDIENGNPTEIGMFAGRVVELGEQLGIETPVNWIFYHGIRVLEEKNQGLFADMLPPG